MANEIKRLKQCDMIKTIDSSIKCHEAEQF